MRRSSRKFRTDTGASAYPKGHNVQWPGFPAHLNCRSTYVPALKSRADLAGPNSKLPNSKIAKLEKMPSSTRASMGGPVSAKTAYDSWLKSQPEAVQVDILGDTRWKLWKKNGLDMVDLVNQRGRPITIEQLKGRHGGTSGVKLPESVVSARRDAAEDRRASEKSETKQTIAAVIAKKDDASFREWLNQHRDKHPGSYDERRDRLVGSWVRGSNRKVSVEMKEVAIREFGLGGIPYSRVTWNLNEDLIEASRKDLRRMYENTQRFFKKKGVKTITLYRGVKADYDSYGSLSSWTETEDIAKKFGTNVMVETFPVEKIFIGRGAPDWNDGPFGNQEEWVVME